MRGTSETLTSMIACVCLVHGEAAFTIYCTVHHHSPVPDRHSIPTAFHGDTACAHTFRPLSPTALQGSGHERDVYQVRYRHAGSTTRSPLRTEWDLCR